MARTPLYKTAETEMIRRITAGEWEIGRRLPNEFVLAEEFKVSQGTMRRALMTLEGQGLLSRKPGRGTIVAKAKAARAANGVAKSAPAGQILSGGSAAEFSVHRAKTGLRGADAAETALFSTGRLSNVERLLRLGASRIGTEEIVVPEAHANALDEDAPVNLADFLTAHGLKHGMISDVVSADITSMSESVSLSCDRHTPLLVVTRTAHGSDGAPMARQVMRLIADGLSYA